MIVTLSKLTRPVYRTAFLSGISMIAAMGGLLFGFDLGIITGVIPFIQKQFNINDFSLGWVVAIFELGCIAGTFIIAVLADKLGRKKCLILIACSFIITTIGASLASSAFDLSIWRFLQGIGVGAASVVSPMYIAEIAPAEIRGRLVTINQVTIILGILLATIASYIFGDPNDIESWRWMFACGLIPAILFFCLLFVIPESPRWFINRGLNKNAIKVLEKIGNKVYAQKEMLLITESLKQTKAKGSYTMLFSKAVLPVLIIGFGVAIIQQFSGSNMVTAYLQIIFEKANISIKNGLLLGVLVGGIFFISTIAAIFLVDKIGRRKLLLLGTSLMAIFLFLLAISFNYSSVNANLILWLVIGFIATYALTLAPVTWVLLSEIFPNRLRGKALSLSSAVLWFSCFLVVLVSPYLLRISPVFNFCIFGILNAVGFIFVFKKVPETKGKSLEQIEKALFKRDELNQI
jgi:SP family arabinose:H+ symporter-like MFS transporter